MKSSLWIVTATALLIVLAACQSGSEMSARPNPRARTASAIREPNPHRHSLPMRHPRRNPVPSPRQKRHRKTPRRAPTPETPHPLPHAISPTAPRFPGSPDSSRARMLPMPAMSMCVDFLPARRLSVRTRIRFSSSPEHGCHLRPGADWRFARLGSAKISAGMEFAPLDAFAANCQKSLAVFPSVYTDEAATAEGADLCMLCTPIGAMPSLAERIASQLSSGDNYRCRKRQGRDRAEAGSILGGRFVGSHPMAGSEQSGFDAARANLFEGAVCIVTPTPNSLPGSVGTVRDLWEGVGCRLIMMPPNEHDVCIARVSHLPHAVAAALVNAINLRVRGCWRDRRRRIPRHNAHRSVSARNVAGNIYREPRRVGGGIGRFFDDA